LRRGNPAGALPELRAAVAAMPFSFRARRSLAEALEASGQVPEALAVRREAVELSAGAPDEKLALATTLAMAGRSREALELFREIEPLRGDDPYFLLNAGQTALLLKQEGPGLAWLERAARADETREDAYAALATFHLSMRRVDEALRVLSEGLLRAPESEPLLNLRARARFFAGDRTGALEDLRHVQRLDPGSEEARRGLEALGADDPPAPAEP
jgi:tetratricopeptide (TPR) repeat protein